MSYNLSTINVQPGMPPPPPGAPIQFMPAPSSLPNCPPGLEYLTQIDTLIINQKKSLLEAFTDWDTKNKYVILNGLNQQVFFAAEDSDCCARQCCNASRGFTVRVYDNYQKEVMTISRPFKCCAVGGWLACCNCCGDEVTVSSPSGEVLGVVRENFGCCSSNYVVRSGDESQDALRIRGPNQCGFTYNCNWCADKVFELETTNGMAVGSIRKKWRGFVTEAFTQADRFSAQFPIDLDVKTKATLLGATILIDFMHFEETNENVQNANGGGININID